MPSAYAPYVIRMNRPRIVASAAYVRYAGAHRPRSGRLNAGIGFHGDDHVDFKQQGIGR
jgi:hypothetical protein